MNTFARIMGRRNAKDVKALKTANANLQETTENQATEIDNLKRPIETKDLTGVRNTFYTNNGTKLDTDLDNNRIYPVSPGDTIYLKHSTRAWLDIYAFLDSNNNVISFLREGETPKIVEMYVIVPDNAVKVLLSGGKSDIADTIVKLKLPDSGRRVYPTWTEGKYINESANIATTAAFQYSEPIFLKKGQKISAYARGYLGNVSVIAKVNTDGTYTSLKTSFDSEYRRFDYVATENCYVAISTGITYGAEIYITTPVSEYLIKMLDTAYFAGDGITKGVRKTGYTDTAKTWAQYLAKMTGATATVVAQEGWKTIDWWTNSNETMNVSSQACAFIKLGQNGGLTDTLDTDASGTDYTAYSDATNTGCYCKIIGKMISQNAKIKIFLIPVKNYDTTGQTNNAIIRKIAAKFPNNCFYVDIHNHEFYNTDDVEYHKSSTGDSYDVHFNTIGNIVLAKVIYDKICEIIDNNLVKFYDF